jgi:hypothetical protein
LGENTQESSDFTHQNVAFTMRHFAGHMTPARKNWTLWYGDGGDGDVPLFHCPKKTLLVI